MSLAPITLTLINAPTGVVISHEGPLGEHSNEAAFVARAMLTFTDGLFAGGLPVRLSEATQEGMLS